MANNNQEVEIKLKVPSFSVIQKLLLENGAESLGAVDQIDVLWDFKDERKSFGQFDQGLRLRRQKDSQQEKIEFTSSRRYTTESLLHALLICPIDHPSFDNRAKESI